MHTSLTRVKRIRKNFGRIPEITQMPNLIEIQHHSYDRFLQPSIPPKQRATIGLQEIFQSVFPIQDATGKAELDFVQYELEPPKYDVDECRQRGISYSTPLKVTLRLSIFDSEDDAPSSNAPTSKAPKRKPKKIKEQDVYIGDMPVMTNNGAFIINGTERVIVSQMHRSPGVSFNQEKGRTSASKKFSAQVIPYRGSWLDFEFDSKDHLIVRIDRQRKCHVTTLLYVLNKPDDHNPNHASSFALDQDDDAQGMSKEDILSFFYDRLCFRRTEQGWITPFDLERIKHFNPTLDLINTKTKKVHIPAGTPNLDLKHPDLKRPLQNKRMFAYRADDGALIGHYLASDVINPSNGLVYAEAGDEINATLMEQITQNNIAEIEILVIDPFSISASIRHTLASDRNTSRESALIDLYRLVRQSEIPTLDSASHLFYGMFFNSDRYDLSPVGRVKLNARLGLNIDESVRVLSTTDIITILKTLIALREGHGEVDDIDHLGNRRVRSVGELIETQYRIGLLRMERSIRERMSIVDLDTAMLSDLINVKPAAVSVREFFSSSKQSQFMDQTNPLSEITHKRRLSALGPGGLTRERVGFEVRDVHPTHYGRICPIETPEGPNIGLISSLATYARINRYGFIESPHWRVVNGQVIEEDQPVYLSAIEEGKYMIAQAEAALDANRRFKDPLLNCRQGNEYHMVSPQQINFIDISPKQLVSVATTLIPFLENDDANRALMGSNMQRQAVPLMRVDAPFVGTGMEGKVARDSGAVVTAERSGIVDQIDAKRIVIYTEDPSNPVKIYKLNKFQRSNQDTCINQKPLVKVGDKVKEGDIIADGPSTDLGELALGSNILVAFLPWHGYNFEDSILISERIVQEDVFTSIHIEEFEVMARDLKLGHEEITRDIPNIKEEMLRNLDEAGIIHIGAEVKEGDILIGKVTPKSETVITAEEKLLRTIFGEKASDVRDSSLCMPSGCAGTVIDVRIFSRRGIAQDSRTKAIEWETIQQYTKDRDDEKMILTHHYKERLKRLLIGQTIAQGEHPEETATIITEEYLVGLHYDRWINVPLTDEKIKQEIETYHTIFTQDVEELQQRFENKIQKLQGGSDLPPGVMKMIKVFVAMKRKIQPGDKMAGRHGNKGVVSKIVPIEDMPYLEDGQPIDIVLNPLGVPSRMNVGQIFETHLGWASGELGKKVKQILDCYYQHTTNDTDKNNKHSQQTIKNLRKTLKDIYGVKTYQTEFEKRSDQDVLRLSNSLRHGIPFATPVFDGAREDDICQMLKQAGLCESGQVTLIDGRTGEPFDRPVTVGYLYMMKLHHLVDDKIHARSVGTYSLVTQQPLGGKAQFGGQRFGEMEVWALEAYGAAYTLQEMLTIKSDDVTGRSQVYEAIVRGLDTFEVGIPESFNVLVKELRSLGLDIKLEERDS